MIIHVIVGRTLFNEFHTSIQNLSNMLETQVFTTKFERTPIGLDCGHYEIEESIALHWNECVDQGLSPAEFREVPPARLIRFTSTNPETGISASGRGYVERNGDKFRLSNSTIEKCKNYLNIQ